MYDDVGDLIIISANVSSAKPIVSFPLTLPNP